MVTAQKRTEALIDVPLSITAVGGDVLERQQASNFQDYLKLVPGLQLDQNTPATAVWSCAASTPAASLRRSACTSTRPRSARAAASSTAR